MSSCDNTTVDINDVDKLCLVCLGKLNKMFSLSDKLEIEDNSDGLVIYNALNAVVSVQGYLNTAYPNLICESCVHMLHVAYNFSSLFNRSQKMLAAYFKQDTSSGLEDSAIGCVEIISSKGKFDIKDLVVVEDEDEPPDFSGYLHNLGTEITATLANHNSAKNIKLADEPKVMITNSTQLKEPSPTKANRRKQVLALLKQSREQTRYGRKKMETRMCDKCGFTTNDRTIFYRHKVRKHGQNAKRVPCPHCDKKFFGRGHMEEHVSVIHRNEQNHMCTVCGKSYGYPSSLTYHMLVHKGDKKFVCQYCGKKFALSNLLTRHMQIHSDSRPHKCGVCGKAFRARLNLRLHLMTHTGDKPHVCKHCGKTFTTGTRLNMHVMQHAGPHECVACDKTFAELGSLQLHCKKKHF